MMALRSCLFYCSILFIVCNAFFNRNPAETSDFVRGAKEGDISYKKSAETFICKDNSRTIPFKNVNDDFCDCPDGTDEPGTSACARGRFTCKNKGYKPLELSSMYVDDGICDCCDGSDETRVKCPNKCTELAKAEFAQLEKVLAEYKEGSVVRAQHLKNVETSLAQKKSELDKLRDEGKALKLKLAAAQGIYEVERDFEEGMNKELEYNATLRVHQALGLAELKTQELASLLAVLLDLSEVDASQVDALHTSYSSGELWVKREAAAPARAILPDDDDDDGDEDYSGAPHDHEDMEDYPPSSHDDEMEDVYADGASPYGDEAASAPAETAAVSEASAAVESPCHAEALSGDPRVQKLLCKVSLEHADDEAMSLIVHLVRSQKRFHEVELVVGYHALFSTFDKALEFVKSAPPETHSCLAEFSSIDGICQVSDVLDAAVLELEAPFVSPEATQAKTALDALQTEYDQSLQARKDIKKHIRHVEKVKEGGHGEMVDLQDKCFDVVDGKFQYSVCLLQGVTQSEVGSTSRTSLGSYASMQENADGTLTLNYENGQHCHAFGARKATVVLTCGSSNVVEDAREPSTCTYLLRMKSPIACTEKYAELAGLSSYIK